jgi:hypothetical protein
MVGGARFISGKSAEGIKPVVAKDTQPIAELGEIDTQEVSAVFRGVASSNSQDGSEPLVDTPIKRSLATSFNFLALLSRQDYGFHA